MQSAQSGDSVRLIRYTVKINKVLGVLKMLNKKNAVLFLCICYEVEVILLCVICLKEINGFLISLKRGL